MPRNKVEQEAICFKITFSFEGAGYTERTGDPDGQGWSVGGLQWCFGQGTLQGLFKDMNLQGPATFRQAMGDEMAAELLHVCELPIVDAVAWAHARSTGENHERIAEPWNSALLKLLLVPGFQAVQRHHGQRYMADARADAAYYGLNSLRALVFFFDVAVQDGCGALGENAKASIQQAFHDAGGFALPPDRKLLALADIVAKHARVVEGAGDPYWIQKDVASRKRAIAQGFGTVHSTHYDFNTLFAPFDEVLA